MHFLVITIVTIIMGIGAALFFTGMLFSVVTAAGLKQRLEILFILFPPVAVVYCLMNLEKAVYPLKLLGAGASILMIILIVSRVLLN